MKYFTLRSFLPFLLIAGAITSAQGASTYQFILKNIGTQNIYYALVSNGSDYSPTLSLPINDLHNKVDVYGELKSSGQESLTVVPSADYPVYSRTPMNVYRFQFAHTLAYASCGANTPAVQLTYNYYNGVVPPLSFFLGTSNGGSPGISCAINQSQIMECDIDSDNDAFVY